MKTGLFALMLGTALAVSTQAELVSILGDPTTSGAQFIVHNDIEFEINSSANANIIIFDEWTLNDSSPATLVLLTGINYGINGTSANISATLNDNGVSAGDVTPNDGFMVLGPPGPSVSAGDTFTLLAGTYDLGGDVNFNPSLGSGFSFSGDIFVANQSATIISNPGLALVPEPTTLVTFSIGCACLARRRRS